MERIIDRFDKYMDFRGLNDNQVTLSCNLSVGLLGKSRKDGSDLSRKSIEKILNFYVEIDEEWLCHGVGTMIKDDLITSAQMSLNERDFKKKITEMPMLYTLPNSDLDDNENKQPILDIRVCAGNGIGLEGDENKIMDWVSIPAFKGCKGIMVFGDSMYDKYKSGDVIFVRPIQGRDDVDYGQCYVVITREDRYIKNLYESAKGDSYVTMVSYNMDLNPDGRRVFPDRDVAKNDVLFLYKVVGKLRRNQL